MGFKLRKESWGISLLSFSVWKTSRKTHTLLHVCLTYSIGKT